MTITIETIDIEHAYLGKLADRTNVYVNFRLAPIPWPASGAVYDHSSPQPTFSARFSMSGQTKYSAGQIVDDVLAITNPTPGWSLDDIKQLAQFWQRWHLNDMKAGCIHQEGQVVYEDSDYGKRVSLDLTPACPVTGYRYGSAWLYEQMTDDALVQAYVFAERLGWRRPC